MESHALTREDLEDVHTLVAHEAAKKQLAVRRDNWVDEPFALPSTLVRQVLINLLLNAINAASTGGLVTCDVRVTGATLACRFPTTDRHLAPEQLDRLFEPFAERERHRPGAMGRLPDRAAVAGRDPRE